MKLLIDTYFQLNQSIEVEPEVRSQIARLYGVLKHLNEILSVDVDGALTNATMNLNNTEFKIKEAEDLLVKTKEYVVKTQMFMQGKIFVVTPKSVQYILIIYICLQKKTFGNGVLIVYVIHGVYNI